MSHAQRIIEDADELNDDSPVYGHTFKATHGADRYTIDVGEDGEIMVEFDADNYERDLEHGARPDQDEVDMAISLANEAGGELIADTYAELKAWAESTGFTDLELYGTP